MRPGLLRRAPQALLVLLLLSPAAAGQEVIDYEFTLELVEPESVYLVQASGGTGQRDVLVRFTDASRDGPAALPGGPDAGGAAIHDHRVEVTAQIVSEDSEGWQLQYTPPSFVSNTGDEETITLRAQMTTRVQNPFMQAQLNVTMRPVLQPDIVETRSLTVNFFTRGVPGFQAIPLSGADLQPSELGTIRLQLTNSATLPRAFGFTILENPCGHFAVPPADMTMAPRETRQISFTIEAPEDKFWYYAEQCPLRLGVFALDNPGYVQSVSLNTVVDGFYVAPEWVFWVVAIVLVVLVVLLFAKRRKEQLEEEILGKPQKPWTIPVEQVYLEHLRRRDERAWYMVRHHLMEEEYQSALLWHKHYRKATRGQRTKEQVVLRNERQHDAWRRRWEKRLERPERKAARIERRLQKRLDRADRRAHRKLVKKHKADVARIDKAHQKKVARAEERYQKEAKRAERKGKAVPPRPQLAPPEYPAEPVFRATPLREHKLHRKAERARRRAVKKRGNLEVRFERKEARRLHQLRKKLRRVGRKIDDPDFVQDHPLLQGD